MITTPVSPALESRASGLSSPTRQLQVTPCCCCFLPFVWERTENFLILYFYPIELTLGLLL